MPAKNATQLSLLQKVPALTSKNGWRYATSGSAAYADPLSGSRSCSTVPVNTPLGNGIYHPPALRKNYVLLRVQIRELFVKFPPDLDLIDSVASK